jgi:hypothetical protein
VVHDAHDPTTAKNIAASPVKDLSELTDEELLTLRMRDLPIRIEGSRIEERLNQLHTELAAREITFRPHYWLSNEWFTPDGVGGIAIPFYLAHPRLARLEETQMLEVEGGTPEWFMQILRHEAGHAIDNAFKLRHRPKRRRVFGNPSVSYPEFYTPKPYSRRFVLHLDAWYAQSHPDEDFAETFAVWLTPESDWQARYAGWPALRKLEYMNDLMRRLAGREAPNRSWRRVDPLSSMTRTLRRHYEQKRRHYGIDRPAYYDRDLRRLFTDAPAAASSMKAAQFIARVRRDSRRRVAQWTGAKIYTIEKVIEEIITRSKELDLRLAKPEEQAKVEFTVLLTVHTMNYLHSGRYRVAL